MQNKRLLCGTVDDDIGVQYPIDVVAVSRGKCGIYGGYDRMDRRIIEAVCQSQSFALVQVTNSKGVPDKVANLEAVVVHDRHILDA